LLRQARRDIPVLFLDTAHHFEETVRYRDAIATAWDLNLVIVRAAEPAVGLWRESTQACCGRHKVDPLFGALGVLPWVGDCANAGAAANIPPNIAISSRPIARDAPSQRRPCALIPTGQDPRAPTGPHPLRGIGSPARINLTILLVQEHRERQKADDGDRHPGSHLRRRQTGIADLPRDLCKEKKAETRPHSQDDHSLYLSEAE